MQKWNIPFAGGTPEYNRAYLVCRHFNKPYDQLTETEKTWSARRPPTVLPSVATPEGPDPRLMEAIQAYRDANLAQLAAFDRLAIAIATLTGEISALSLEFQDLRLELKAARAKRMPSLADLNTLTAGKFAHAGGSDTPGPG
jgi:hypothetical protein